MAITRGAVALQLPAAKMAMDLMYFGEDMPELRRFFDMPFDSTVLANIAVHLQFNTCMHRMGLTTFPLDLSNGPMI